MASDINYDRFDYHSQQDYWELEYQIDLFEFRYSCKSQKQSKRKVKKSSYPISMKSLKSNPELVKAKCMHDKKTPKAQPKRFRYDHRPNRKSSVLFECDQESQTKSANTSSNVTSTYSHSSVGEYCANFLDFRRHFYQRFRQKIKSAIHDCPSAKIANIRFAPIDSFVQNQFMENLNANPTCSPKLVYHGTNLKNIEGILRYGFLIPNQPHPKNSEAPIITSLHGQAYGIGIYCSTTATYSTAFMQTTNTLLVCAALPRRGKIGQRRTPPENIIVLPKVEQIIPLFLVDIQYTTPSQINRPLYSHVMRKEPELEEKKIMKTPVVNSRKYLRKILALINDEKRKHDQYQVRTFESFYS